MKEDLSKHLTGTRNLTQTIMRVDVANSQSLFSHRYVYEKAEHARTAHTEKEIMNNIIPIPCPNSERQCVHKSIPDWLLVYRLSKSIQTHSELCAKSIVESKLQLLFLSRMEVTVALKTLMHCWTCQLRIGSPNLLAMAAIGVMPVTRALRLPTLLIF